MESITPSRFLGPLNELSGVATESERSMVNMAGRPHEASLRGRCNNNIRNVISNVTDNSLNVPGTGNIITINIHHPE